MGFSPAFQAVIEPVVGLVIGSLVVIVGLSVLNLVATVKIITKAGYSASWILVPLSPVALWIATYAVLAHAAASPFRSATSIGFDAASFVGLWVVDGVGLLLPWVMFLVFALSDWPVRRQLRDCKHRLQVVTTAGGAAVLAGSPGRGAQIAAPDCPPAMRTPAGALHPAAVTAQVGAIGFAPPSTPVQSKSDPVRSASSGSTPCPRCSGASGPFSAFCDHCGLELSH